MHTRYQHVVITERIMDPYKAPVYSLHINGHTQFSSFDEQIYHSMLVYPAMAASARHDSVLVIGGGDGLAVRDILKWDPTRVVVLDLDKGLVDFFSQPFEKNGEIINKTLLALNQRSFSDSRVDVRIGDAFLSVDTLLANQEVFDTIIVDLPDPNHPDLNKLYSSRFYAKLRHLLAGDGAISVQSTSPYHAPEAYISIGKTMKHAGFPNVDQYHTNVPSFGEWGWTIATAAGASAKQRLQRLESLPINDGWMTREVMLGAFAFYQDFYKDSANIKINRINSNVLYEYHRLGWSRENGLL
jgi:spermidine synthase